MNVCMDIQPAIAQRAGVGRYVKLLAQNLGALTAGSNTLTLCYFDFTRKASVPAVPNAQYKAIRSCPGRLAQLAWKTIQWPPFNMFSGDADVFHFPNFILPPLSSGKSIATIHDMSFMRFPQFAEQRNCKYLSARILDTVRRASAIITDSGFSAMEIHELLNVPANRIFPIHLGIDSEFRPQSETQIQSSLAELNITRPYILTLSTIEPRKNIPFLIQIFERLTDFPGDLVISGMPGWQYKPIMDKIKSSPRAANIHYLNYVPDHHLPALYAGAELFLFTSFYEGFGLPPLEAMACNTPVISSATGSLPETLGSAATLLDTFDLDLWVETVRKTLFNSDQRRQMSIQGRKQAAKYSWTETARKTWDVYKKVNQ